MVSRSNWEIVYLQEIHRAQTARDSGNEGMARVCARRAVGIIIGEYMRRRGLNHQGSSAYQRLKQCQSITDLNPRIRHMLEHFIVPVDHDHQLPIPADLLAEAKWLAQELLEKE